MRSGYHGVKRRGIMLFTMVYYEILLYILSLIGIILKWGFLIWELILIYCGLFVLILVVFVLFFLSLRFGQISPVITGDTVTRLSIPIRGCGKITWRRPEVKFGWNVVKEKKTQKLPRWGQKVCNKYYTFVDYMFCVKLQYVRHNNLY